MQNLHKFIVYVICGRNEYFPNQVLSTLGWTELPYKHPSISPRGGIEQSVQVGAKVDPAHLKADNT